MSNTRDELTRLLQGNTAWVPPVTQPTMESQELHQAGGSLADYKRGPSASCGQVAAGGHMGRYRCRSTHLRDLRLMAVVRSTPIRSGTTATGLMVFCSTRPEIKVRIKTGAGAS